MTDHLASVVSRMGLLASVLSICLVCSGCGERDRPAQRGDSPHADVGESLARDEKDDVALDDFEGTAGIVDKERPEASIAVLREVRAARHSRFDRVVFEFEGTDLPGYRLEYVDRPVRQCGSGDVVSVAGDSWLEVRFIPSQAHTDAGEPTVKERERHLDLPVLKEIERTCDFEAHVTWVLGLASPNRYRVVELDEPARLVVDVKH